jgi:hypothetical protein
VSLIVVATVAAATAEALPTAAAAARGICFGLGFVDLQCPAAKLFSIQGRDCLIGFAGICHFDEGESAGATGFAIGYDAYALDCAMRLKQAAEFRFGGAVRQIPDV